MCLDERHLSLLVTLADMLKNSYGASILKLEPHVRRLVGMYLLNSHTTRQALIDINMTMYIIWFSLPWLLNNYLHLTGIIPEFFSIDWVVHHMLLPLAPPAPSLQSFHCFGNSRHIHWISHAKRKLNYSVHQSKQIDMNFSTVTAS